MVTAIILINAERDRISPIAEALAERPEISEVYSVAGAYDLVAIVRVSRNEALADLVTGRLAELEGITATQTLIAFKTFSRHDLESMFSLGLD